MSKDDVQHCFERRKTQQFHIRGGSLEREHFENLYQLFSSQEDTIVRRRDPSPFYLCFAPGNKTTIENEALRCAGEGMRVYFNYIGDWSNVISNPYNFIILSEYFAGALLHLRVTQLSKLPCRISLKPHSHGEPQRFQMHTCFQKYGMRT